MKNKLELEMDVDRISTPKAKCIYLEGLRSCQEKLQRLEKWRYDFAPVIDGEQVVGLIKTTRLGELVASGSPMTLEDLVRPRSLTRRAPIVEVVGALIQNPTIVVFEGTERSRVSSWCGLVATADLNRHYFRSRVYLLLAEMEEGLANVIRQFASDDWIKSVSPFRQNKIRDYCGKTERGRSDRSPVDGCTLSDMIEVVAKNKGLQEPLGFASSRAFRKHVGGLNNLRNDITHPVRPMICEPGDVQILGERLKRVETLIERIDRLPKPCSPSIVREARARAASAP